MTNLDKGHDDNICKEPEKHITEKVCILVDKIFSHCRSRECFPDIENNIGNEEFKEIKFKPGFIVPGTLKVIDLPRRKNFKRVKFTLRIPYEIITDGCKVFEEFLPDIEKDVILFIPQDKRDEFDFKIIVETSSRVLGDVTQTNCIIEFAAGVFIIIKVVGKVQLYIKAFGYCPKPPKCEEFCPDEIICDRFDRLPFPEFFPPQFKDVCKKDKE